MKKLYAFLIALVLMGGCCIFNTAQTPKRPYVYMSTKIERVYTYGQFDSLCVADRISNDLDRWDATLFVDDNETIKQYMYVVSHQDTTITYSVIPQKDSTIFVNKRIVIE
jgi:hypothetical protein